MVLLFLISTGPTPTPLVYHPKLPHRLLHFHFPLPTPNPLSTCSSAPTHSHLFLEVSDGLLHLQLLRIDVRGGGCLGGCGRATRQNTVLLSKGRVASMELLVVILLQ